MLASSTVMSNPSSYPVQPSMDCGLGQQRTSRLDGLLDVETYQILQGPNIRNVQNHGTNSIKALSDMFTCKLTNFPITVAMFTQQNNKEYLSKLANELYTVNRIENVIPLRFSKLLFLFPLVVSAILGYFVGMITNWQVGLSIGHIGMFIQITFLVLIITGSRFCHKVMAIRASHKIAQFLQWIKLFLSVCFCYPTKPVNNKAPVRTIVVYHRLWPNSTTNIALFSLVEKMWFSLIRHYGQVLIRLQRAGKPCAQSKQKFKKVCCLPAFFVMISFWIAFLVSTSILRFCSGHLAKLLAHGGLLPIFVLMTSIMFLSFFGSLPSIYRVIRGLTINPIKPIQNALAAFLKSKYDGDEEYYGPKSAGKINEAAILCNSASFKNLAISAEEQRACKADMFIKSEFGKVCNLSLTFDKFMNSQQTRFILCLDATECTQKDVLAKIIYQIHNLILSDSSAPVAIVLEANFQILLGDLASNAICLPHPSIPTGISSNLSFAAQTLSDNYHLVHASIHLPLYLEPPIFTDIEDQTQTGESEPNRTNTPPNGYPNQTTNLQPNNRVSMSTHIPRAMFDNVCVTYANKPSMSKIAPLCNDTMSRMGSAPSCHQNNGSMGQAYTRSTLSFQYIAGLFLNDNELADWNSKIVKQLVFATSFSVRFLKMCNIEIPIDELVVWINLVQHWPCHMAWLIIYLEELNAVISAKRKDPDRFHVPVNLTDALHEVKNRVAASIDRLGSLTSDDRDLEKLHKYLMSKSAHTFTVLTLKRLASCTLTHNPFFRICIKALTKMPEQPQPPATHQVFSSNLGTLMEEQNDQTGCNNHSQQHKSTNEPNSINQSTSAGVYASIRNHMGRSESNQGILQASTASLSSMENIQSNQTFPPAIETLTVIDPNTNKPYFIRLRNEHHPTTDLTVRINSLLNLRRYETKPLNQFTVNDVCDLISCIADISPTHIQMYQNKIRQLNLNGLILSLCDLNKLRQELMMHFADWQLFYKLVISLRAYPGQSDNVAIQSEQLNRTHLNDMDESESGSFKHSVIIQNKHAHNTSILSENSESVQIDHPNQSSQVLIRQTPWLMSPQIPLASCPKETVDDRTQEISYSDRLSAGSTDQQNSCSGMEEPESLWKVKSTPPTCKSIAEITTSTTKKSKQPSSIHDQSSLTNQSHPGYHCLTGEAKLIDSQTNDQDLHFGYSKASTKPKVEASVAKSIATSSKHDYTSRSTIDLRTAFGPTSQFTLDELVNNPSELKMTKRSRIKKALHDRKWLMPNLHGKDAFYAQNALPSEFYCSALAHGIGSAYQSERYPNLTFDEHESKRIMLDPRFIPVPDSNKVVDIKRLRKHPRRRFEKRLHGSKTLYNPDLGHYRINGNALHGLEQDTDDIKIPEALESESDSFRQNSVDSKTKKPNQLPPAPPLGTVAATNYYRDCFIPNCGRIIPSPALTPAQLASLQSYAAWSNSLNHLMSTTGIEDPNVHWNKYFQITPNPMAFLQSAQSNRSESRASKPSQKKRPRKCSNLDDFPVVQHGLQTNHLDALGFEKLMQPQQPQHQIEQQFVDPDYTLDSDMDECTCDYWYELEKNRGKFTLSEPSLRAESEESTSAEYYPDKDHSNSCRCNK